MAGRPTPPELILASTAGPLNANGTALLFEIGARVLDDAGKLIAPVSQVLTSILRKPSDKHAILDMYAAHGVEFPDTPTMAVHRGRIDGFPYRTVIGASLDQGLQWGLAGTAVVFWFWVYL